MKHQLNPEIRKLVSLNNYEELRRHLLRLTWRQQMAIQLRFWEDCSIYQVAYQLGISWGAANELIESAIRSLQIWINESAMKSAALAA